jgi:low temperature requirement protein LtrA
LTTTPIEPRPETDDDLRVSTLELFFDLVFVFTLTQLSGLLQHDPSPIGALRVVLVFIVLFWMYGGYVWLTNQVPPVVASRRLLLVGGMAGFLVCALAIPRAFGSDGLAFGAGYAFVVVVHAGLYANAYGPAVLRFVPFNLVGAGCVLLASALDGPVRYVLWAIPIALQYIASYLTRHADEASRSAFDLRIGHFVERHGLLLIVAFGESVVAIGAGIGSGPLGAVPLQPSTLGAAVLALVLVAALWWTYFGGDEDAAGRALVAASLTRRVVMALNAYFYAFVPILLGVVTLAAGLKLAIGDVGARLSPEAALLLGGGTGLYLAGDVAYRLALGIMPMTARAVAAVITLLTVVLGIGLSGLAQLTALLVLLLAMHAVERRLMGHDRRHAALHV